MAQRARERAMVRFTDESFTIQCNTSPEHARRAIAPRSRVPSGLRAADKVQERLQALKMPADPPVNREQRAHTRTHAHAPSVLWSPRRDAREERLKTLRDRPAVVAHLRTARPRALNPGTLAHGIRTLMSRSSATHETTSSLMDCALASSLCHAASAPARRAHCLRGMEGTWRAAARSAWRARPPQWLRRGRTRQSRLASARRSAMTSAKCVSGGRRLARARGARRRPWDGCSRSGYLPHAG
jgi:hypothetical protein